MIYEWQKKIIDNVVTKKPLIVNNNLGKQADKVVVIVETEVINAPTNNETKKFYQHETAARSL